MPTGLRHLFRALLLCPALALAQGTVVTTENVKAELLAHAPEGIAPGKAVWLGLAIDHQPHWHTYWKNPGDSGLPTSVAWVLPEGVTAGDIEWPAPRRLPIGPLVNYGYEGKLLLPVPLVVGKQFRGDTLDVKLRADWLVCRESCIPEFGEFRLKLPVHGTTVANADRFAEARSLRPKTIASAQATGKVDGELLSVQVAGLPGELQGKPLEFFAADGGVIDHAGRVVQTWSGDRLSLRIPLSSQRSASPQKMEAVLALPNGGTAVQIGFVVDGPWPAPGAGSSSAGASTPQAQESASTGAGPVSVALAMGLAFIGGLLLNLMPCVFPVLSLKVIGFAQHANDRRALLSGGLAYTAGVIASFVALAAVLVLLRGAGAQLGWGFQLQSPPFVAALAVLFTLIGLNLAGVFELGGFLPSSAAAFRAKNPVVDNALTGVLAVAIASPCTAPFMGVALGAALALPMAQALAIFAALGAGMAAPYLAASAWPGLGRLLPRSGPWMVRFKVLMSFPMFATVIWLVWVLGQQVGIDAAAAMLGVLLAVSLAAWVAGAGFGQLGRWGFGAAAAAVLVGTLAWAWPSLVDHADAGEPRITQKASHTRWQAWSTQAVGEAQAAGRPVFIDFTAAWCVTCQYNKRTTLANESLLAELDAKGVSFFRADWTRRDPAITQQLNQLGRSGVPVYALYGPGQARPQLLSEILSVTEIRDAVASWPRLASPVDPAAQTPRSF